MTCDVENFEHDPRLAETLVTYPQGDLDSTSRCVGVVRLRPENDAEMTGVITETTAIHPVSSTWPDQPADKGRMRLDSKDFELAGAIETTIARSGSELGLFPRVPKRRVDAEEAFEVVLHLIKGSVPVEIGMQIEFSADSDFRENLSRGHSICHLQAIALNQTLADYWKKAVDRIDSLGHPDFDQIAITSSKIHENSSVDVYRVGRSLRKKGFNAERLINDHEEIRGACEAQLRAWIASGYEIEVSGDGGRLGDRRNWSCKMESVTLSMPCGGTHIPNTLEIGDAQIEWALSPENDFLTVTTKAVNNS